MGQDASSPLDERIAPQTLSARTLDGVAAYITAGRAKKIVIMAGAGISTSAGIPDFRSPGTGLYANLARLNLPYAEAVFDISYFRENPAPFYTLAKELYPGKYRPTITHCFFRLLHDKGLLLKLFTQNIDCLEREAGVPGTSIVEAHGSFATQACVDCGAEYPSEKMEEHVHAARIPRCGTCKKGLVKPRIVFFGEQLPDEFHDNRDLPADADLCIVLGTSLTVQPFASLPGLCAEGVPRVLINKETVGGLGSRPDDVLLLGDCDEGVRRLAKACGWEAELEGLWQENGAKDTGDPGRGQPEPAGERDIQAEVDKLTKEVEETLSISRAHTDSTARALADGGKDGDNAYPEPDTPRADTVDKEETPHPVLAVASEAESTSSTGDAQDPIHLKFMSLALSEARKSPPKPTNFCVGAVLVSPSSDPPVLASGYTLELPGNTHAEQCCLLKYTSEHDVNQDGLSAALPDDAVLYTTMEPCSLRLSGNLPCTERILQTLKAGKGIRTVYVGMLEPEKFVVENTGRAKLVGAGVQVVRVRGLEKEILAAATAGHAKI